MAMAAYQGGSSPFALGHQDGVEVPRMYSGRFTVTADDVDNTTFTFGTANTSTDGDPVMLLLDDRTGEPIDIADDYFSNKDPMIGVDLAPGETRPIRVVVASYDEAYAGQTDVVIHKVVEGQTAQEHRRVSGVRFGSARIDASWQEGDVVRAVGHYESQTLRTACETELGGEWDFVERDCVAGSDVFDPATTCELAYASEGLRFNAVYPHGSRCEKTSLAKDTMLMAAEGWSKEPVRICFGTNCYYVKRTQSADNGGFDDDSGAASTAKLVMPSDSNEEYPAIVVGLHPWNDRYGAVGDYSLDGFYSTVESDEIRVYRDRALTSNNDPDDDGLTSALENVIGLDTQSADTSKDGMMDGLVVYGSDDLPLPNLGAVADQQNVLLEVDRVSGWELTQDRVEAMRAAGYALDEAGINLLALTGEYATYEVTTCWWQCLTTCEWVCSENDEPVLPETNATPVIPDTEVDPQESCGTGCLSQASESFDLSEFPFARRMGWTNLDRGCGVARLASTGIGRFGATQCIGSTFAHELGHMLGLHHGGRGDGRANKPNYWSVMSYGVQLPLPEHGYTPMWTKETANLNGTRTRPARFSDTTFTSLDENSLDEEAGLTGGNCLNGDCSDYSAPYTFESIRDPSDYYNWTDITVGWLDWNDDGSMGSNVAWNIDRNCSQLSGQELWVNFNLGCATDSDCIGDAVCVNAGTSDDPKLRCADDSEAICWEELQPNDDHSYFANMMDQSYWSSCGNLDKQRAELGLDPATTCFVSPPSVEEVSCD